MDSDVVALIGVIAGVLGAAGGVGAWIVAIRANLRAERANTLADDANRTADRALKLQARIDDREREYRDVLWGSSYIADRGLTLTNHGLTDAVKVTLVVHNRNDRELHHIGDVPANGSAKIRSALVDEWMNDNETAMPITPPFRIHWSSPLGLAEEVAIPAAALFSRSDD